LRSSRIRRAHEPCEKLSIAAAAFGETRANLGFHATAQRCSKLRKNRRSSECLPLLPLTKSNTIVGLESQ
jgi:hypothetical protein